MLGLSVLQIITCTRLDVYASQEVKKVSLDYF